MITPTVERVPAQELNERDAQRLNKRVREIVKDTETLFYTLSDHLYTARCGHIWKALGLNTWEDWLEGMDLAPGYASDMLRIAELQRAFPDYAARMRDAQPSKMRLLVAHVSQDRETREWRVSEDELDELLNAAEGMSWRYLREYLDKGEEPPMPPTLTLAEEIERVIDLSKQRGYHRAARFVEQAYQRGMVRG